MDEPANNLYGDVDHSELHSHHKLDKKTAKKKADNFLRQNTVLILLLVLLLAVSGALSYLYYKEKGKNANPLSAASEETKRIKEAVGKHMLLPDEEPAIATIIDINKLKAQNAEFYANGENGDKLLVYSNKAILYDPERDLILNVAPIVKPAEGSTTTGTPTPTPTPTNTPTSGTSDRN